MPTAERVLFMMSELATYGMVSGLLFHHFHFSKKKLGSVMALLLSMIAGRLVYGFVISIAGLPGIVIQLLFVPAIVTIVDRGGYFNEPETFTREA